MTVVIKEADSVDIRVKAPKVEEILRLPVVEVIAAAQAYIAHNHEAYSHHRAELIALITGRARRPRLRELWQSIAKGRFLIRRSAEEATRIVDDDLKHGLASPVGYGDREDDIYDLRYLERLSKQAGELLALLGQLPPDKSVSVEGTWLRRLRPFLLGAERPDFRPRSFIWASQREYFEHE